MVQRGVYWRNIETETCRKAVVEDSSCRDGGDGGDDEIEIVTEKIRTEPVAHVR